MEATAAFCAAGRNLPTAEGCPVLHRGIAFDRANVCRGEYGFGNRRAAGLLSQGRKTASPVHALENALLCNRPLVGRYKTFQFGEEVPHHLNHGRAVHSVFLSLVVILAFRIGDMNDAHASR